MTGGFGDRVRAALHAHGPLCVGIDPHESLLSSWSLASSAAGVREFGMRTVDAAAGRVGFIKPQVSFFERFGSAGFAALEDVFQTARAAGLIVIADAKRGDIGTTMDAYASAWLTPGSPLEADARMAKACSSWLRPAILRLVLCSVRALTPMRRYLQRSSVMSALTTRGRHPVDRGGVWDS